MTNETFHAVWLHDRRVGIIHQKGDYTRFTLAEEYRADVRREVLGLIFEQDALATHSASLRLPPWFSNLLPEGSLREWIASARGVSPRREMELLAQVGHDLPGAVRVLPMDESPKDQPVVREVTASRASDAGAGGWRFSLAGVALKFSAVANKDRLTVPAYGEGGDWIVKLPNHQYPQVPLNEYTMMSLASAVGIDVPPIRLVHRDELDGLPSNLWPDREEWAYAIRRFDRDDHRGRVHIEDLAQVRNFYPEHKYEGNFETVAAILYRRRDLEALREFTRRLVFMILISNGDGHLKNWSLIYSDPHNPTLSPAYDLVATAPYSDEQETLALKFAGSRRFVTVTLNTFGHLERRLAAQSAGLKDVAAQVVADVERAWPEHADHLHAYPTIRDGVTDSIRLHTASLLGRARVG
jgi:serine/threonine-protein kinase HipA